MKVLVLNLPPPAEVIQLDITPIYHMREVGKNQHTPVSTEAIEGGFEGGAPWGREAFDRILGEYEHERGTACSFAWSRSNDANPGGVRGKGLTDYPAAVFLKELIEAYLEAAAI
ncbi:hypothetical protein PG985_015618 [Apiospora marii]|uniref:uncharacterized protein n=1 Tax=Apiospora marii TaxID=335849 RepID=UPI00312E2C86